MAAQNMSGFSLSRPNSAGSEPTGSSVAETNAAMNTVLSPYCGSASSARRGSSQACMCARSIGSAGPGVGETCMRRRRRAGGANRFNGRNPARRYNRASFFSSPALRHFRHEHRPLSPGEQPVRRADGGRDRPAVPPAVPRARRRLRGQRDGHLAQELWSSLKTSRRANHEGEPGPIAVQIAGTDAAMMAEAAAYNIDRGAQIIDINMGCPAKKVCNKWAGSALMQDEPLALAIAEAVVAACAAARRAGHAQDAHRLVRRRTSNAVTLARALRRRRRADAHGARPHARAGLQGQAEYDTIAAVKAAVRMPVVANGDIDIAREGARRAGVDRRRRDHDRPRGAGPAVDLSRDRALPGAPARTWRRRWWPKCGACCSTTCRTTTRSTANSPACAARASTSAGMCKALPGGEAFRARMNSIEDCAAQLRAVAAFFDELARMTACRPACRRRPIAGRQPNAIESRTRQEVKHEQETHRRMRAQPAWKAISATCAAPSPTACTRCWCKVVEKPLLEVVMAQGRPEPVQGRRMAGPEPQHAAQEAGRTQTA